VVTKAGAGGGAKRWKVQSGQPAGRSRSRGPNRPSPATPRAAHTFRPGPAARLQPDPARAARPPPSSSSPPNSEAPTQPGLVPSSVLPPARARAHAEFGSPWRERAGFSAPNLRFRLPRAAGPAGSRRACALALWIGNRAMLLLCSRSRSSALFCSSRSRRRPARPCVRDALRRCPVIKSGAAMLLVAQGTAGGLSPQPLVLSPHRGRRLKGRSSRLGVRYGPQPAKAADASVRSPGAETAAQRLIAAGCRLPLTLRRNWTVIELAFAKEDHRISDTERAGLQCHGGCLRQRRATSVLCLSKFPCKNSQGPFLFHLQDGEVQDRHSPSPPTGAAKAWHEWQASGK
jgi:hypothetical protein